MVILNGNVRDGKKSTSSRDVYISGAVLTQGSGWSVTTNESGFFYTSANTKLDLLSINANGYKDVTLSIPIFATHYDGNTVISGALTQDISVVSGYAYLIDTGKLFVPDVMSGRILTMMGGIDDGKTAIIEGNTVNMLQLGGVSGGGGGVTEPTWTCMTSSALWMPRHDHACVTDSSGNIVVFGGFSDYSGALNDVWRSEDLGVSWVCIHEHTADLTSHWDWRYAMGYCVASGAIVMCGGIIPEIPLSKEVWVSMDGGSTWQRKSTNPEWTVNTYGRSYPGCTTLYDNSVLLTGGVDSNSAKCTDAWRSDDFGATWTCMTSSAEWVDRAKHQCVTLSNGHVVLMGGDDMLPVRNDVWMSDDNGASWNQQKPEDTSGWSKRMHFCAGVISGDTIVVLGGYKNTSGRVDDTGIVWKSADEGQTWSQTSSIAWCTTLQNGCGVIVSGNTMILTGGRDVYDSGFGDLTQAAVWRGTGLDWSGGGGVWYASGLELVRSTACKFVSLSSYVYIPSCQTYEGGASSTIIQFDSNGNVSNNIVTIGYTSGTPVLIDSIGVVERGGYGAVIYASYEPENGEKFYLYFPHDGSTKTILGKGECNFPTPNCDASMQYDMVNKIACPIVKCGQSGHVEYVTAMTNYSTISSAVVIVRYDTSTSTWGYATVYECFPHKIPDRAFPTIVDMRVDPFASNTVYTYDRVGRIGKCVGFTSGSAVFTNITSPLGATSISSTTQTYVSVVNLSIAPKLHHAYLAVDKDGSLHAMYTRVIYQDEFDTDCVLCVLKYSGTGTDWTDITSGNPIFESATVSMGAAICGIFDTLSGDIMVGSPLLDQNYGTDQPPLAAYKNGVWEYILPIIPVGRNCLGYTQMTDISGITSIYTNFGDEGLGTVMKIGFTGGGGTSGGGTTGTVITHAASGDLYNIGGVSSEPTDHIIVTAWGVSAYSDD
jgi:Kelch motif